MKKCLSFFVAIFVIASNSFAGGQGLLQKVLQPNGIGGGFVATHLDGLGESSTAGPGVELFLKYNLSKKAFFSVGTGMYTITDATLKMENFRTTLLPTVEVKVGYNLLGEESFSPFIFAGLHAYGSKVSDSSGNASPLYYDGGAFAGGGLSYAFNGQWAFHVSGDYRYIFTATGDPKPKLWIAKAGVTYSLQPKSKREREEIEYPLGEGELTLDDLFKEEKTGKGEEEDALALLFGPETKGTSATKSEKAKNMEITYPDTEVGRLMARVQELKDEMEKRIKQIDELQSQVKANERAIASVTGKVAGDYTVYQNESLGGLSSRNFKENYEIALQKFYAKQYQEAIRIFRALMISNPDHRLASNCQYWIGESYNAMGMYGEAINAFNAVMNYGSSYKFDDALIMSGLCNLKIGNKSKARDDFQTLVSQFPDSEYAPKAMRYLGRL